MKNFPILILSLVAVLFVTAGNCAPPIVAATYGKPADYWEGILKYPDFTVRYRQRTEETVIGTRAPWFTHVFHVLDNDRRTIGGEITFTSAQLANVRRFDVRGKIYLAEMGYTTAGVPTAGEGAGTHTLIPQGRLIIWDEDSAKAGNAALTPIWAKEKVEPGARWSSRNAYADGELLPGFSLFTDVSPSRPPDSGAPHYRLSPVIPLSAKSFKLSQTPSRAAYSERVIPGRGVLSYPDFFLQLQQRTDLNPPEGAERSLSLYFLVFDSQGRESRFFFTSRDLANGRAFTFGDQIYFAEMYSTTAGTPAGSPSVLPLREGELIIWNQSTATAGNPRIASVWTEHPPHPDRPATWFAAGVPLQGGFTGTYMIGRAEDTCRFADLDLPIVPLQRAPAIYPPALAGSGFVGHVGGYLIIKEDGSVDQAVTTSGNEGRFQSATQQALKQWRFSPPTKGGKPVKALVSFEWTVSEPSQAESGIEFF
ncbi:MAG: energy transducer TonB [Opitutaceae bacterium]|jgi:hypothetical protein|nr:energy transducer TonB [Opitutaceae bacterium]